MSFYSSKKIETTKLLESQILYNDSQINRLEEKLLDKEQEIKNMLA